MRALIAGGCGLLGAAAAAIQYSWSFGYVDPHPPPLPEAPEQNLGALGNTAYNMKPLREPCHIRAPLAAEDPSNLYDCVIIGGGFAGLHAALSLAERNKRVLVLEGRRVGSGSSGRNGGDAIIGFQTSASTLAWWLRSDAKAKELYSHSRMGFDRLSALIAKYDIKCDAHKAGALTVEFQGATEIGHDGSVPSSPKWQAMLKDVADGRDAYGEQSELWSRAQVVEKGLTSPRYSFGWFEPCNIELNPLELSLGLARACESTGKVTICELSPVESIEKIKGGERWKVATPLGAAYGRNVLLATNTAPPHLAPMLAMRTTQLTTAMMLTKELPKELLDSVMKAPFAVFENRLSLCYFRRVPGNKLLFGSLASATPLSNTNGATDAKLLAELYQTFPTLKAAPVTPERTWQGKLTTGNPLLFPLIGRQSNGMYYSLGFCGHGLVPTCAAGELLASAMAEGDNRYQLWSEVTPAWMPTAGPLNSVAMMIGLRLVKEYEAWHGRK